MLWLGLGIVGWLACCLLIGGFMAAGTSGNDDHEQDTTCQEGGPEGEPTRCRQSANGCFRAPSGRTKAGPFSKN